MGGEVRYSYGDLARVPSFLKLWMGDLASQTSDRMAFVAITVMVYGLAGSSLDISVVMGAYFLPAVIVGIPGGMAADRFSRRTVMVAADGVRVAIALAMVWAGASWFMIGLVMLFSSLTYLYYPSRQAAIPNLVPEEALMPANAVISANLILGFAIGPAVGGLVTATWGAEQALMLAAGIMLIGVLTIVTIRDETVRTPARASKGWLSLKEGLSAIRARPSLWQGFVLVVCVMFAVGAGAVGLVVYGDEVLGMGEEGFSLLLAALAVGTLVGAFTVGRKAPVYPKGRLLIAAALMAGVMLVGLSLTDLPLLALVIMFLVGVAAALVLVPFSTMLQEQLGDQVMGTSFGLLSVGLTAPMVAGIGVAGPVIEGWDVQSLFVLLGAVLVVVGLVTLPLSILWRED